MKHACAIFAATLVAASALAVYEALDLAPGIPVRVTSTSKVVAVQVAAAGTNAAVTGATVSLVRGTATNTVATGIAVTNGLVTATPGAAVFAIAGDGLLLDAGSTNAVSATAITER